MQGLLRAHRPSIVNLYQSFDWEHFIALSPQDSCEEHRALQPGHRRLRLLEHLGCRALRHEARWAGVRHSAGKRGTGAYFRLEHESSVQERSVQKRKGQVTGRHASDCPIGHE